MAVSQVIDHPKFANLRRRLQLPRYALLGVLETLWQMTAKYAPHGDIGRFTDEEIASWLEWPGDEVALVRALIESGWCDEHDEHRVVIHDWHAWAPDYIQKQLGRARLLFANGELPKLYLLGADAAKQAELDYEKRSSNGVPLPGKRSSTSRQTEFQRSSNGVPAELSRVCEPKPKPKPKPKPREGKEKYNMGGCATSLEILPVGGVGGEEPAGRKRTPKRQSRLVSVVDLSQNHPNGDPDPDPDGDRSALIDQQIRELEQELER